MLVGGLLCAASVEQHLSTGAELPAKVVRFGHCGVTFIIQDVNVIHGSPNGSF